MEVLSREKKISQMQKFLEELTEAHDQLKTDLNAYEQQFNGISLLTCWLIAFPGYRRKGNESFGGIVF